jgi:phosphatidylinositol 3,5-bisphosphate 5-phosphatase
MSTYRKINEWKSHSRDVVESFKRYYHNSFLDSQRQEAYNLFLGNYIYAPDKPMLWDLSNDYYLHHADPRLWSSRAQRSYIDWYDKENLALRQFPAYNDPKMEFILNTSKIDDYWLEYYRSYNLTVFAKMFAFKTNSRSRYIPDASVTDVIANPSPFIPRRTPAHEIDEAVKKTRRQLAHVNFLEPLKGGTSGVLSFNNHAHDFESRFSGQTRLQRTNTLDSIDNTAAPDDRSQWTLKQWHDNSLAPKVTEEAEYVKYVEHPQNLAFTVSASDSVDPGTHHDFSTYLSKSEALSAAMGHTEGLFPLEAAAAFRKLSDIDGYDDREDDREDDPMVLVDEAALAEYAEFLALADDPEPLTVTEEDGVRKRYKAYRQWLKGRSFFKLYKLDPEYMAQNA